MKSEDLDPTKLHSVGAIVRHNAPFYDLKSFRNGFALSQDFIDKWVVPFYMNIRKTDAEWIDQLNAVKPEIDDVIIRQCLGDFNWRTRQTGAFFAAITNRTEFIDIIGTHLLKSEVCYAGGVYCQVFASFNLPQCVDDLNRYLDHYLMQPDLWFDQRDAMEAILYLDKINGTHHFDRHLENWMAFIRNKPYWRKEIGTDDLERQLEVIKAVRGYEP
ncbi:MAG: DUF6000 family protein [Bacteroidia bacterium]